MAIKIFEEAPAGFQSRLTIVGCYCLYAGKFLLLKRHPNTYAGGTWCLPAGKLEKEESRIEGARRELYEEVGLEVLSTDLLLLGTLYLELPNLQYEFSIFQCTFPKEPVLHVDLREHTEALWLSHEEALKLSLIHGGEYILDYCRQKQIDT